MTDSPLLTILIVNWNTRHLLADCIRSIEAAPPSCPFEILVIDNASADDSMARLSVLDLEAAPLRTVTNSTNLGLATATNQGIAASEGQFILLLNPDTVVPPGAIDRLFSALEAHPEAGAAGPRLLTREGRLQISVLSSPPHPLEVLAEGFHLIRLIPQPYRGEWFLGRHWKHDRFRAVPLVFGAAVIVRRAAIAQAGGLSEEFPMYASDEEWCARLRGYGWKILFVPEAEIVHLGRESAKGRWNGTELNREIAWSRLRFFHQAMPRPRFVTLLIATLLAYTPNLLVRRLLGLDKQGSYMEATCALYLKELTTFCRTGKWLSAE